MKNIMKFVPAALMASALMLNTSCKDSFLEVEPPTQGTPETYFNTEDHILEALAAAYVPMHMYDYNTAGGYSPLPFSDILGDDFLTGAAGPTDQEQWHRAGNYNLTGEMTLHGYWAMSYDGIKACTEVVDGVEANKDVLSEAVANNGKAEAQVLRCYYYSIVWKWFGNIPYYNHSLGAFDRADQLDHDAAYEAIITDLESAIALNALPMYQTEEYLGRMTQATAYMLYAELVMYQNDQTRFNKALEYMGNIIAEDHYQLNPSFADIWTPDGEWCNESIFEINYTDGAACVRSYDNIAGIGGTWLPQVSGPDVATPDDDVLSGSWGTFIPRRTAKESFEAGDLRVDPTFLEANTDDSKRYQQQGLFQNKYIPRKSHVAPGTGGAEHCRYNDNFRVYRYAETLLNAAELLVRGATASNVTRSADDLLNEVRTRAGLANTTATLDNIMTERRHEFCGEGKRYWDLVRMEDVAGATQKASTVLVVDAAPVNAKGDAGRTQAWTKNKKYIPIKAVEISASEGAIKQNDEYFK